MPVTKPLIDPQVQVVDVDGEAVVYHPNTGMLHYLNHSAALVLDLCDGETTMRQMAEAIADVYEMPVGEIEPQVRSTVRDLRGRSLLVPTRRAAPSTNGQAVELSGEAAHVHGDEDDDSDERQRIRLQVPRST